MIPFFTKQIILTATSMFNLAKTQVKEMGNRAYNEYFLTIMMSMCQALGKDKTILNKIAAN